MDARARVVLGVDGSECARAALEFARAEAARRVAELCRSSRTRARLSQPARPRQTFAGHTPYTDAASKAAALGGGTGPSAQVFTRPRGPYTRRLVDVVPVPDPGPAADPAAAAGRGQSAVVTGPGAPHEGHDMKALIAGPTIDRRQRCTSGRRRTADDHRLRGRRRPRPTRRRVPPVRRRQPVDVRLGGSRGVRTIERSPRSPGRVPGPATRRRRALAGSLVALLAALDDPSSYVGAVVSGTPMSPLAWLLDTVGPLDLEPEELSSDPFYLDQLDNDPGRGPARSAEPGSGMNDPTSPHW